MSLTNDFDDRMGDPTGMYTAVIFNPVPGPPMGKNTRLSFRAWIKGSDKLRVQIYSLSNGYHRHLTLKGLEQGKWLDLTVDMTHCRKPDGSGGVAFRHRCAGRGTSSGRLSIGSKKKECGLHVIEVQGGSGI